VRLYFIFDFDCTLSRRHIYNMKAHGADIANDRQRAMELMKPGLAELFPAIINAEGRLLINTHAESEAIITSFLAAGLGLGKQGMDDASAREFISNHVFINTRDNEQMRAWQNDYQQQYIDCLLKHADDNGYAIMAFAKCVAINEQLKLMVDNANELSDCICYFVDDDAKTREYMQWVIDEKVLSHISAFAQFHIVEVLPQPDFVTHLQTAQQVVTPPVSLEQRQAFTANADLASQAQQLKQLPLSQLYNNALRLLQRYAGVSEYAAGRLFQRLREGRSQAAYAETITQVLAQHKAVTASEMQQRAATVELLVHLDVSMTALTHCNDPSLNLIINALLSQVGLQQPQRVALLRAIRRKTFQSLQEDVCLRLILDKPSALSQCVEALKLMLGMPPGATDCCRLEMVSARCALWLDDVDMNTEQGKLLQHYRQWFAQHAFTPSKSSMREIVLAIRVLKQNAAVQNFPEILFAHIQRHIPMRLPLTHSLSS